MDGSIVDPNQKALKVDLSLGRLGKSVTGRSPGPSLRLGYPYPMARAATRSWVQALSAIARATGAVS